MARGGYPSRDSFIPRSLTMDEADFFIASVLFRFLIAFLRVSHGERLLPIPVHLPKVP
jgi:hypothetical protein